MSENITKIKQLKKHMFADRKLDLESIGGRWLNVPAADLISGRLKQGGDLYNSLISCGWNSQELINSGCESENGVSVVIAARVVASDKTVASSKKSSIADQIRMKKQIENLNCLYYIPAVLNQAGELKPCCSQWPWFDQAVSTEQLITAYNEYTNQREGLLGKIPDWKTWLSLSFDLFQKSTGCSFQSKNVFGYGISEQVFIIPDTKAYKFLFMRTAYNRMIEKKKFGFLTSFLLSEHELPERKRFYPRGVEHAFAHSGHVDNYNSLPASHRSVVEQMIKLEDGGILAINSPLGTGPELCVLDNIASRIVNSAVLEEKPPLSAVLINDVNEAKVWKKYFQVQCDKNFTEQQEALALLGYSWISGSGLMAATVIGDADICDIDQENIFSVGISSDRGLAELDNPKKIKKLTEKVIENCGKYFKEELPSLEKCRSKLHETLVSVDYARQSLLQTGIRIKHFVQEDASGQDLLFFPEDELDKIITKRGQLVRRLEEWAKHFKAVPLSLRIGSNSDLGKIKLKAYYEAFRNAEEIERIPNIEAYEDVEKGLSAYDKELAGQEAVLDEIVRQQDKTERMIRKLGKIGLDIEMLKKYISQPDKINLELDRSLRLLAFWLSVHYYECRWLAGESIVLMHQRARNDDHSATRYLNRLSLLSPCILAEPGTLMSLKGMKEKSLNDLYVLNAQQLQLAQVLPVIDLAKRLYVFGDPAASEKTGFVPLDKPWNKPKKPEKAINGLNLTEKSDSEMESIPGFIASSTNGLGSGGGMIFNNDSDDDNSDDQKNEIYNPNFLNTAADRTAWFVAGRDGMWLFDNIKAYEEIATYASMQWFNDKLKATRGQAPYSGNKAPWLPMSLWQIDTNRAQKNGFEYTQEKECDEIIRWIRANYDSIKTLYSEKEKDEMVVIATPYIAQKEIIEQAMLKEFKHLPQAEIRVGSIDEFSPGETYPLVIFSGVFSRSDAVSFYVDNRSLLHRVVGLAEDSIIYFGDINALPEKDGGAATRLRRKLKPLNRKK